MVYFYVILLFSKEIARFTITYNFILSKICAQQAYIHYFILTFQYNILIKIKNSLFFV